MIKIESIKFEHNRMHVKLNTGKTELRHLLNWPLLFSLDKKNLENNKVLPQEINWPRIKFTLKLDDILNAKKL